MGAACEDRRRDCLQATTATAQDETTSMAARADCSMHAQLLALHGVTMTPDDAAPVLHKHPATVRKLCAQGELPCVKLGKSWLIPTAKLAAYLDGEAL
jgi:excisionase family DNA binding protein